MKLQISFTAISMLFFMTLYESVKQMLFPGISVWDSHLITIAFSTVVAGITACFIFKKQAELYRAIAEEMAKRRETENQLLATIDELKKAMSQVKTLNGFLPLCASCKKIRSDDGYWNSLEKYIEENSDAVFSHGLCPDCLKKLYPDFTPEKPGLSAPELTSGDTVKED